MAVPRSRENWAKTRRLLLAYLAAWLIFSVSLHLFVGALNKISVPLFGFPLGLYLAVQGALIAFIVMLFMFAKQQDELGRD